MKTNILLDAMPPLFDKSLTVQAIPTLVISDTHCPYQNKTVLLQAIERAKEAGCKQVIHAGDLIDGADYSTQAKAELHYSIDTELEHAKSLLDVLAKNFNKIICIPGNHDSYYYKKEKITFAQFIKEAVAQHSYTRKLITTEYDYVYYGKYAVIGHPQNYSPIPGELASQLSEKYKRHCLIGHDHLHGYQLGTNGYYGISIGMMAEYNSFFYKERAYNLFPDSNVGFIIITARNISLYNDKAIKYKEII